MPVRRRSKIGKMVPVPPSVDVRAEECNVGKMIGDVPVESETTEKTHDATTAIVVDDDTTAPATTRKSGGKRRSRVLVKKTKSIAKSIKAYFAPYTDDDLEGLNDTIDDSSSECPGERGVDMADIRGSIVSFSSVETVYLVPTVEAYTKEERKCMWTGGRELRKLIQKNTKEFLAEGCDWREVLEEDSMVQCPVTGESIHPVHVVEKKERNSSICSGTSSRLGNVKKSLSSRLSRKDNPKQEEIEQEVSSSSDESPKNPETPN